MDTIAETPHSEDLLDDSLDGTAPLAVNPPVGPELELTPAQEQQMLELWNKDPNNPPRLKQITQALFGHECDGRHNEGKAVKKALSKHNLRARVADDPERVIELSEAHKLYILNNAKTNSALDMARTLFANPNLVALAAEVRAVQAYINSLRPTQAMATSAHAAAPTKPYIPPKTLAETVERINEYVRPPLDLTGMNHSKKKEVSMLMGYLHTYRFIAQMNNYVTMGDRSLCEDAFIRATYDKPDLAQEEIDQYIEYANQVVNGFTVNRRKNQLEAQLEDIVTSNDESLKISMSLVESIGKASTEYHQCLARQQKLLDDLKEKRSSRLSKQIKDNASILNLIQMWKSEEGRQEMMQHAEREQLAVKAEVGNLSSMDDLKARILGLTKEEIING
jgi:hypothetical protein